MPTCDASKVVPKSTVSASRSPSSMSSAAAARRHSVYLMAAGGSSSSEPKLPWPDTCEHNPSDMTVSVHGRVAWEHVYQVLAECCASACEWTLLSGGTTSNAAHQPVLLKDYCCCSAEHAVCGTAAASLSEKGALSMTMHSLTHQRQLHAEVLCQAHQCIIDR